MRGAIAHSILVLLPTIMTGQIIAAEQNKQPVQTVCVGRFLIDLPATARIRSWSQSYQGHDIFTIPNVTLEQYQANVKKRVAEWQAEMQWKVPVFDKVQRIGSLANAVMITKWKNPDSKKLLVAESYYWVNGTEVISGEDGELWPKEVPTVMEKLEKIFPRIQHLKQGEIPEGPGFCMNGAWFPQDGSDPYDWEMMDFTFELTSNPDVQFWFSSNTIANKEPIIARDEKYNEVKKQHPQNFRDLRKGERNIGPFKGQELDERVTELNGVITHSLNWESIPAKSSNALDPLIRLEAKTGASADQEAPINSSLKDDELLQIWDGILNSIRLRPTGPVPTGKTTTNAPDDPSKVPPQTKLGTQISTGNICPQTGLWRASGQSGTVLLRAGEGLPSAKIERTLTAFQKLKGEQAFEYVATVWTLVQYTDNRGQPLA
jgi:hypothetical protein